MKPAVLICALIIAGGVAPIRAGSVLTLEDRPEATGKLTLTADTIRVDGGTSPAEVNLPDILEANFGEAPFQLNFFTSGGGGGNSLPPAWKSQDIGDAAVPGSLAETAGTLVLTGNSASALPQGSQPWSGPAPKPAFVRSNGPRVTDDIFFAGQPWTGDGEWTARVAAIKTRGWQTTGGLMLRDSLDPGAATFGLMAKGLNGGGGIEFRAQAGDPMQETPLPLDLPVWFRLTRLGTSVSASISTDGKTWDLIAHDSLKLPAAPWIGLFVDNRNDRLPGNGTFDQVSFTPAPSEAQVLPPGVLLQSGSFLAGAFESLKLDPATPDAPGSFNENGKYFGIPRSKIASILMLPAERNLIAGSGANPGLVMKNGDVLNETPDLITATGVRVSSVLLGVTTYNATDVRACLLQPVQPSSANYEIRLRDGSMVYAGSFQIRNESMLIEEASGVNITIAQKEIAQVRAGPAVAQSLAELDWKAVLPPAPAPVPNAPATNSAPAAPAPAATNSAPGDPASSTANVPPPPANPAPDEPASPNCWKGPNQEEIIEAATGTTLNFPLTGKFNAICARIALSPDSPPNVQATVRVLADGREIGRTPPFGAGDAPRLLRATVQDPKTVAFEVDSLYAGPKVLFIDPVAIRDHGP
jgi:hypothetical protein